MPTTVPTPRENNPATTTPLPTRHATRSLSTRTRNRLAPRPPLRLVVDSMWDTLAELERAGHHPRLLAAVRYVLLHHEPSTAGRCRAWRRVSWRGLWRRRRFPCLGWRQIRGELLGHLCLGGGQHRREPVISVPDREEGSSYRPGCGHETLRWGAQPMAGECGHSGGLRR
ncbi:MAG: hypothetical protein ACRDRX_16830 [Pseudonocardiaceae bacterium]